MNAFWLESVNLSALELAASAGFAAAVLDMEHGIGMNPDGVDQLITFGRAMRLKMWVRVSEGSRVPVQRALDSGATGVILPQIESVEQAARSAAYAKYPPMGNRGIGYGRTMYNGMDASFPARENQRTKCYIMIETVGALNEAEEIAALECVDGLFIGPADLSMNRGRGLLGQTNEDFADYRKVALAARNAGKEWSMPATIRKVADFAREEGATFLVISDDLSAMRTGFTSALENVGP